MQVETSREAVEHFIKVGAHLRGRPNLPNAVDNLLLALIARAEAAENALFTLRNRAGCGPDQSGPDVWQQRDAAIAERDALRDEWEEIAAGITTEQPEVGALWPMVSEINGNLAAARNLFRNEVVAHNRTKAERDRLREALEIVAGYRQCMDNLMSNVDVARVALTSAKEA